MCKDVSLRPSIAVRRAFAREEGIAHLLGGLLFVFGGLATIALVLAPTTHGTHEGLALLVGLAGLTYGLLAAFVLPWERLPFVMLHVAGLDEPRGGGGDEHVDRRA